MILNCQRTINESILGRVCKIHTKKQFILLISIWDRPAVLFKWVDILCILRLWNLILISSHHLLWCLHNSENKLHPAWYYYYYNIGVVQSLLYTWQQEFLACRNEEIGCSLTLYGHTARVWDARLLSDCIVSIGEDATCRVWTLEGQCLEVVGGHKGRSIWSLAVDCERQVVVSDHYLYSVHTWLVCMCVSIAVIYKN